MDPTALSRPLRRARHRHGLARARPWDWRPAIPQSNFDFKWADNLQHPSDVMNFYISGDVAPEGKFNYRCDGE
jgi:hypothetical protein